MPRLREAQIPIGRKVFQSFLKLANVAVVIFGIMTVVLSLEINPTPTFSWLLILLGGSTMLGGLTGFGGTILPCCYKSHLILMSIAIFGTGVFCLVMFGQRPKVVASFKSSRFPEATEPITLVQQLSFSLNHEVDHYLSSISWVYVFVVIIECVALVSRVIFQRMGANQQFESIEQTQDFRNVALGKMRQDIVGHSDRVDKTRASNIDNKMKDKYAKWSHETWGDSK